MLKKETVPRLLAATALASAMPALAQDTSPPETSELVEIVVTGTRATRDGYQAPSPTNVIGAVVIDNQAATGLAISAIESGCSVLTPYTVLNTPVYGAYYDEIGRQYSLGLDVTF